MTSQSWLSNFTFDTDFVGQCLFATLSFLRGWTYSIAIRLVGTKDTFGANANWEFLAVLFICILFSSICEGPGDFLAS